MDHIHLVSAINEPLDPKPPFNVCCAHLVKRRETDIESCVAFAPACPQIDRRSPHSLSIARVEHATLDHAGAS
jgi:hypothetical protein